MDDVLAVAAAALAALSLLGLAALYLLVIRPLQVQVREQAEDTAQWRKQAARLERLEERSPSPGDRPTDRSNTKLEADLQELRREVDYLKNKLSTLLTPPETPPHPLPSIGYAAGLREASPHTALPAPPPAAFENQRISDITARYRERLRRGHIDALTQHFSVNPNGLFLELDEHGERLVFPAQEVIYAGDFEQNYRFVFDCAQPGSGYVVVESPARLDAQGQVIARGRLRIE
ncbi:MAG: hypothetical protein NZ585_05980 [Chloracidobacterium sp.]|nr:hypothetical protein [Chloracidobacterium sp.]MDW8216148.1 hypothetical protein [Acidobacteriota bacterium]